MSRRWENCGRCRATVERVTNADGSPADIDPEGWAHRCRLLGRSPLADLLASAYMDEALPPNLISVVEARRIAEAQVARALMLPRHVLNYTLGLPNGSVVKKVWFDDKLIFQSEVWRSE